jgi:DNA-binding beta-propeller fold protein YncE
MKKIQISVALAFLYVAATLSTNAASLKPGDPVLIDNAKGKFDFIRADSKGRRLLLAHTENKSLDVIDLDTHKLLKSIPTGAAQDAAVDSKNGLYFVSVSAPPHMAIIDSKKLEVIGEVTLPAAADLMNFNPATGMAYVCNDTAGELWVIDPAAKKIVNTIILPGKGMEDLVFDYKNKKAYQVVKAANVVSVIDLASNAVVASYPVAPATNPHGIAYQADGDTVLITGGGGKAALMSRSTGKILAVADTVTKTDEMAYDGKQHRAYFPNAAGKITILGVEGEKLTPLGEVDGAVGARSIAIDTKTHTVWLAYPKGEQSFAQPFTPGE